MVMAAPSISASTSFFISSSLCDSSWWVVWLQRGGEQHNHTHTYVLGWKGTGYFTEVHTVHMCRVANGYIHRCLRLHT